jgi:hypothetical protein
MAQFARALFLVLLFASGLLIGATVDRLPVQLASSFGSMGEPHGWMSRHGYLLFMLFFAIGIPLIIVFGVGMLPRWMGNNINLPNRDYWLTPARREGTLRYLEMHAYWLGSMLTAFIAGVHFLIIEANATQPPHLPGPLFAGLLIAFGAGSVLWGITMVLHFRRVP